MSILICSCKSQRVDNLTESVHKVQEDTVNNAEDITDTVDQHGKLGGKFQRAAR